MFDDQPRGVGNTVGDDNFLDLITKGILDSRAEPRELGNLVLVCLLFLRLPEFKSLLGKTDELLAAELLQLSDGILIDGADEEKDSFWKTWGKGES